MIKFLLQALAFVTNRLPKTDWKPIPLCDVYAKYDLNAPNLVGHVTAPSVTTGSASSIGSSSFTMGGTIDSNGGENASVRGFVYSTTNSSPTTSDSVASQSGSYGAGAYSLSISGLTQNTLYYVRAYATNSGGTGYGSTVQVTTAALGPPTVITNAATSITTTTATANGNISATNGATVTERGFVWATSADPTVSTNLGKITQTGSYGTGTFTGSMTGLSPSTLYYVRAYAINSYGTNYGSNQTFSTSAVPTVRTVGQYRSDFLTRVPTDWYTGNSGISENLYLQAEISNGGDPETSTVTAKAEIEQVGTAFDNVANRTTKPRTYKNDTIQYAKRGGAMVYDSHNKRYIFFGGYDGTTRYNEVWEKYIDVPGQPWNRVTVSGTPPVGRNLHAMTYVKANLTSGGATRAYAIVWGGADPNDRNDMWALRLDTPGSEAWTQITQTNAPTVRSYVGNHMVATPGTDSSNNYIYLFGGWASTRENQLVRCTFDVDTPTAITWTTLKANGAAGNPAGRSGALLDYKASTGQLLLYGGNTGSMVSDFWIYTISTNTWQQRTVSGTAFAGAEAMAGGYDSINNRFWVTGGWTTNGNFSTSRNSIGYISNVGGSEAYVEVRANDTNNQSYPGLSFPGNTVDPDKGWLVIFQEATVDSTERYDYIIDFRETATSDFPVYSMSDGEFKNARDAMSSTLNTDYNEWVQTGGFEDMYDNATIPNGTHSGDVWSYSTSTNSWRYAVKGFKALPQIEGSYSCYDTNRDRIIVFGALTGATKNGNDVWSLTRDLNGNYEVKQLRPSGTRPSPRWLGFAVYDEANDRAIFGLGGDNSGPTNNVWALNFSGGAEGTWSQLSPTGSVTGVIGPAFGVAKNAKRVYIFGGATNGALSTVSTQTAYFDYSTTNGAWTTISTTNALGRRTPAADFDEANNTFIVYGGFDGSNVSAATSFLRLNVGTAWEHNYPVTYPAARRSVIGQLINGKFYIDSGRPNSGTWFKDTWEYTPDYTTPSNSVWVDRNPNVYMPVYFTFSGGTSGQEYHWQAWSTENSTDSAKVSFGGNAESDGDFILGNAPPAVTPTVTSSAATNITPVSATANGAVTDLGYEFPSERGIVYSLASSADPTVSTNLGKIPVAGDLGSFSASITGLSPSTQYKYRAYATNSAGTGYSTVQTFTTTAYNPKTFTLSAVLRATTVMPDSSVYVTLYNRTKGLALPELALAATTTPTLVTKDYEVGDTNFHDGDEYEVRVRADSGLTVQLYSAKLYIRLHELKKVTTWNRISRFGSAALQAAAATTSQRFLYESGKYSNPKLYWEITGQEDIAGTNDFGIYDVTTTDQGTSGTTYAATRVDVNSASKIRQRVDRISLTNNNRYMGIFNRSSGGARYQSGIVGITASGDKGTVSTQTMLELVDVGRSSQAAGSFTPLIWRTPFNPLDVDNATYYFEVIGRNINTTTPYNVELISVNGSGTETVISTMTLPANTGASNTRWRTSAITVPADTTQFRVRLPQTASDKQVVVEGARLIISQTNANRTLVHIPLGGSLNEENNDTGWPFTSTTQTTYGQVAATEDQATIWKRDDSEYDRYVGLGKSPTVALNTADGATVTTTPSLQFTGTDPESNDITYQIQISNTSSIASSLAQSNLIISNVGGVTGDTTAIDRAQSFTTTAAGDVTSIVLWLSKFGSPTDDIQVKIYTDNANSPGTLIGTSSNGFPLAGLPTSSTSGNFGKREFVFEPGVTLANATRYWFVTDRTGAASGTNYYSVEGSSATAYGSESGRIWNGSSWATTGVLSLVFELYTRPTQAINIATSNASVGFSGSPDNINPFASGQQVSYNATSRTYSPIYWDGVSSAFDNNTSTYAYVFDRGDKTYNYLRGIGTNAPSTGAAISTATIALDFDNFYNSGSMTVYSNGEELGTVSGTTPVSLSTPTGGWTWQKVQNLEVRFYSQNVSGFSPFGAARGRVIINGTTYYFDGGIDALPEGTYYWRARGTDPSGSNLWGEWSSVRSFNVVGVANYTRSHGTSSVKGSRSTKTHTTSANKKKANNTLTHLTDTYKTRRFTASHSTGSFLRKQSTVSHTTSAVKGGRYTRTHTTSANKKKANLTVSHTTDTFKTKRFTASHTTDSLLRKQFSPVHTTSAVKRKATLVSHTTSSVIRKQNTASHTTNALKRAQATRSHTTDAFKKSRYTLTHTTDAHLQPSIATLTRDHSTSSVKRKQFSASHSTSSVLRKQNVVSHTTSSNKKKSGLTVAHTTNSVIRKQFTTAHTTNTLKRSLNTKVHTSDALKRKQSVLSHTTDSLKKTRYDLVHTTDANKRKVNLTVSHTTSSNKKKANNTVSHTTSANKKKQGNVVAHTTSSVLRRQLTSTHTTDTLKRKQSTLTHTTSSVKRKATTVSHTTSSVKRSRNTLSHTTNSFLRKRSTISHTADARKYKPQFSDIVDNFDDNTLNTAFWEVGTWTQGESFGKAQYFLDGSGELRVRTTPLRTLIGNSFFFQYESFLIANSVNVFELLNSSGTMILQAQHIEATGQVVLFNGAQSTLASWSHNNSGSNYLRFRESGGTFYVDSATAPGAWTNRYSGSTITGMDNARFQARIGDAGANFSKGGASGTIDNFNVGVAQYTVSHTTDSLKRKATTATHTADALKRKQSVVSHTTSSNKKKAALTVAHTTDSNKRKVSSTLHSTSSVLRRAISASHTTSAVKRKINTLSHSTDALKKTRNVASHTTDAFKKTRNVLAHTTDALLLKVQSKAHTTSTVKRKQNTLTHTSDALKRSQNVSTHATDAFKKTRNVVSHTTDSFIRTRTALTHTADALLRKQNTVSHTTSANKKKANNLVTHTTSANKRKTGSISHSASTLLRSRNTRSHTTDALVKTRNELTQSVDAFLRKANALVHLTDSFLRGANQLNHTTSANKRKAGITVSHTTSANKRKVNVTSHTTSALKRTQNALSHTTDTLKRQENTLAHSTDALLKARKTLVHTTDSLKRTLNVLSHTTDTLKRTSNTTSHTTDALKRIESTLSHATDSLLRLRESLDHTTDTLKRSLNSLGHSTDSLLREQNTVAHTTDARTRVPEVRSHTTDALKKTRHTLEHSTDTFLRRQSSVSHTTDSNKKKQNNTVSHVADAFIRGANQLNHNTDANKKKTLQRSHTTDTVIRIGDIALAHTTDSFLRAQVATDHSTDTVLRVVDEVSHSTDSNLKKTNTVTHSTSSNKRRANNTVSHTTSSNKKKTGSISHATDTLLRELNELSHSTDVLLRSISELSHTTDTALRSRNEISHSTDANKRKASEANHATDANKRKANTLVHTTDANKKRANQTIEHSTDSFLRTRNAVDHSTDSNLKTSGNTVAHATASYLRSADDLSHATDANKRKASVVSHSTSANKRVAGRLVVHTTDTLKRTRSVLTHSTSTVLRTANSVLHTTDANKKKQSSVYHLADAFKRKGTESYHNTDANLRRAGLEVSHATDANKKASGVSDHKTDTVKRAYGFVNHTTDSNKKRSAEVEHSTDTFLRESQDVSHDTDAYLRIRSVESHSTDANLKSRTTTSHSTSAVTRSGTGLVHYTDTNKKSSDSVDHTTDANRRKPVDLTHQTDAYLKTRAAEEHTTDSFLRVVNLTGHLTDAIKRKANATSHATSSNLKKSDELAHSTDAYKKTRYALSHSTDSFLRGVVLVDHSTDANKKRAQLVIQTTDAVLAGSVGVAHTADAYLFAVRGNKKVLRNGVWQYGVVKVLQSGQWVVKEVYVYNGSGWYLSY